MKKNCASSWLFKRWNILFSYGMYLKMIVWGTSYFYLPIIYASMSILTWRLKRKGKKKHNVITRRKMKSEKLEKWETPLWWEVLFSRVAQRSAVG